MPENHLLVIPLPNGIDAAGNARLSVFFSPRLVGTGPTGLLRDFPWRAWPNVVNDAAFGLSVAIDTGPVPTFTVTSPKPDPAVWAAVFGEPTTTQVEVEPWQRVDRTEMPFPHAYSPGQLASDTMSVYSRVAVDHADQLPTGSQLSAIPEFAGLVGSNLDDALAFIEPLTSDGDPADVNPLSLEFHATIGHLAAHPELLRLLGLVVDIAFQKPTTPPTAVTASTDYASMFPGGAGPCRQVRFRTAVDADFRPLSNPDTKFGDQLDGFLPLAGGEYDITSLDTLVGIHRLDSLRTNISPNGNGTALPAMREHGISVIRKDMRTVMAQKFERQADIEDQIADQLANPSQPAIELFGEDVTQGQRYDAREKGATAWLSLFDRHAPDGYVFPTDTSVPALDIDPEPDEGWQGFTLMTEAAPVYEQFYEKGIKDKTPQRIHDNIFRWTGWSAATRMPGRMLDGEAVDTKDQPDNEPAPTDPVQFAVDYRPVPGTLPRLRYGHTYDMRARCVDLAGNSRAVAEPNPDAAQLTETFGRLQPVEPPTVVRRSVRPSPGVGDNTTALVIKSEHDQPDTDVEPTDRLFFPPRLSQHRVEFHDLPNGGVDPDEYGFLRRRDAHSLADQTVVDPESGELVAGVQVGDVIEPGIARPRTGFLADPSTDGIAFDRLPGSTGPVVVPYGAEWPNQRAVRLQLRAGDGAPDVNDPGAPTSVWVELPKACRATVEVSSAIDEEFLAHFKLWHELTDDERTAARDLIISGRHWMISPRDTISLVHAVRLPLVVPALDKMSADRTELGTILAEFSGTAGLDRKSTAELKLLARWTDPVDDPTEAQPGEVSAQAVLARLRLDLGGPENEEPLEKLALNMHDTKRHVVELTAEAYSRFSRYFTEEAEITFTTPTVELDSRGVVASSVVVTAGDTTYTDGEDYAVDGTAGTITRLKGSIKDGDTVATRFVPRPVSRISTEDGAKQVPVLVPSSARPLPPEIEEVLPAFERKIDTTEDSITVVHDASILRVRVRRPWWSTGDGELLGVVLDPASTPAASVGTTRVGRDPLRAGSGTNRVLTLTDFTRSKEQASMIDGIHDVAGHEVEFESDRQLWAADIGVGGDLGYRPFVRLALARYQPDSIPGAHISPIVETDPVRMGASRTITVDNRGGSVEVTVEGPGDGNEMRVGVQQANLAIADPDLRWETLVEPAALVAQPSGDLWNGTVTLPKAAGPLRVVVEDHEPTKRSTKPLESTQIAYVDAIDLPDDWL